MTLIRLHDIAFRYNGTTPVLDGLELELHHGDRVIITGDNGTGKSTLFHLIMGLIAPLRGDIHLFGAPCSSEEDFKETRKRIGLLFQEPDHQLFCPSVLEDVAFGPLNLGYSHKDARDLAMYTLTDLGISHLAERPPYHLSGGEKRLVALAGVLAMKPDVLLLDEPTNGLDRKTRHRLLSILKELPLKGIMIISHDLDYFKNITNRRLFLENGKISEH